MIELARYSVIASLLVLEKTWADDPIIRKVVAVKLGGTIAVIARKDVGEDLARWVKAKPRIFPFGVEDLEPYLGKKDLELMA